MNITSTISIMAGGIGSGCNPRVGKCGRIPGKGTVNSNDFFHQNWKNPYRVLPATANNPDFYKKVKKAPIESVPVKNIIPTQKDMDWAKIKGFTAKDSRDSWNPKGSNPVAIARYNGKHYLVDGHHRVAAQMATGNQQISARVVDVKGAPGKGGGKMGDFLRKNMDKSPVLSEDKWQKADPNNHRYMLLNNALNDRNGRETTTSGDEFSSPDMLREYREHGRVAKMLENEGIFKNQGSETDEYGGKDTHWGLTSKGRKIAKSAEEWKDILL